MNLFKKLFRGGLQPKPTQTPKTAPPIVIGADAQTRNPEVVTRSRIDVPLEKEERKGWVVRYKCRNRYVYIKFERVRKALPRDVDGAQAFLNNPTRTSARLVDDPGSADVHFEAYAKELARVLRMDNQTEYHSSNDSTRKQRDHDLTVAVNEMLGESLRASAQSDGRLFRSLNIASLPELVTAEAVQFHQAIKDHNLERQSVHAHLTLSKVSVPTPKSETKSQIYEKLDIHPLTPDPGFSDSNEVKDLKARLLADKSFAKRVAETNGENLAPAWRSLSLSERQAIGAYARSIVSLVEQVATRQCSPSPKAASSTTPERKAASIARQDAKTTNELRQAEVTPEAERRTKEKQLQMFTDSIRNSIPRIKPRYSRLHDQITELYMAEQRSDEASALGGRSPIGIPLGSLVLRMSKETWFAEALEQVANRGPGEQIGRSRCGRPGEPQSLGLTVYRDSKNEEHSPWDDSKRHFKVKRIIIYKYGEESYEYDVKEEVIFG